MGQTPTVSTPFGSWLKAALKQREWGIRTLARKMNPAEPEVARRALNRYLYEGSRPSTANRAAIADALGVDPDEMPSDDEEEEDAAAVAAFRAFYATLKAQISASQPREQVET